MKNFQTIAAIWCDQYPPSRPRRHLLIEKILITPVIFLRFCSLDQLKSLFSEKARHDFMDCYVLGFAAVLIAVLAYPTHFGLVGGIIAGYRIADILTYRVFFLLVKSQESPWEEATLRRSLVIVVLNFFETIIAFAILYLTFGNIVPTSVAIQGPFTSMTALYYSAVTALTLGYGDFVPSNALSRAIVMFQLFGTLLFLIFVIPALVSVFSTDKP
jgi:hypothetical protein